jgi:hypothetical protein
MSRISKYAENKLNQLANDKIYFNQKIYDNQEYINNMSVNPITKRHLEREIDLYKSESKKIK